jgi:predicted RNase H-like nuclease (RuvC/YqgF family)
MAICLAEISATDSFFAMQSLADAARREASRREDLERRGIEAKVIEGNCIDTVSEGNLTLFEPSEVHSEERNRSSLNPKDRNSLRSYRTKLQKLDNDIRKGEARLENLRSRLDSLRRKSLGIGTFTGFSRNEDTQDRTQGQIEELRVDLKMLKKERRELYDQGRKEGYLPGELEGKGIIP